MEKLEPFAALLGRILLALLFIGAGFNKFGAGAENMVPYMENFGVPGFLFWPTVLFEILGGIAILIGFQTRIVAFLMAGFSIMTAVVFHADFSQQVEAALFMKNLAIGGGFLILFRFGAGEFSMDNRASAED